MKESAKSWKNTFFEFLEKILNFGPLFLAKTAITTPIEATTTKITAITTIIVANTSIMTRSHLHEIKKKHGKGANTSLSNVKLIRVVAAITGRGCCFCQL